MSRWKKVLAALGAALGLLSVSSCLICAGCGSDADRKPKYSEQDLQQMRRIWEVQHSEVHDGPQQ